MPCAGRQADGIDRPIKVSPRTREPSREPSRGGPRHAQASQLFWSGTLADPMAWPCSPDRRRESAGQAGRGGALCMHNAVSVWGWTGAESGRGLPRPAHSGGALQISPSVMRCAAASPSPCVPILQSAPHPLRPARPPACPPSRSFPRGDAVGAVGGRQPHGSTVRRGAGGGRAPAPRPNPRLRHDADDVSTFSRTRLRQTAQG